MRIGAFNIVYLSHVCFRFRTRGGKTLITDPFFGPGFVWQNKVEHYLSPPAMPATDIRRCDAIFISHEHGDHFDPPTVMQIHKQTGCKVIAAPEMLEVLASRGLPKKAQLEAKEAARVTFGDLAVTPYDGYDDSKDAKGRPNKFAITIESRGTKLFYSGDCHELPPAVRGMSVDALFSWPHPTDEELKPFVDGIDTDTFVVMHSDKFAPGDFWCNFDPKEHAKRIQKIKPGMRVRLPKRAQTLSV